MLVFSVTTVCPPDSGAGWLITGVELMVTDRLPCATAQGPSVTDWFTTIEPVRALITTRAEGVVAVPLFHPSRFFRTRAYLGGLTVDPFNFLTLRGLHVEPGR